MDDVQGKPRDFVPVIEKVIEHLMALPRQPIAFTLVGTLEDLKTQAGFKAPEAMEDLWNEAARALHDTFGTPPWENILPCLLCGIFNNWQPPQQGEVQ